MGLPSTLDSAGVDDDGIEAARCDSGSGQNDGRQAIRKNGLCFMHEAILCSHDGCGRRALARESAKFIEGFWYHRQLKIVESNTK